MPLLLLMVLGGCKKVEEAPRDLDALARFFWDEYDAEDAVLAEAVLNLHDAIDGDALDATVDGTLSPLDQAALEVIGLTGKKPRRAQGLYLTGTYACDLDTLAAIITHPHQDELFAGAYDAYDRRFTSSRGRFLDKKDAEVAWDVTYSASILGAKFTADITASARWVRVDDPELAPFGDVLVERVWLPEPAEFDNEGTAKSIAQDYQIEVWYERERGELVHLYGMWREASFGTGFDIQDEGVQRIILNNLDAWDADTAAICAEGGP